MLHVDYYKVSACSAVKIFKNEPLKISNRGARARCAGVGSAVAEPLHLLAVVEYLLPSY